MKITREIINQGMSDNGGWTRAQTELLGVNQWPLPHGWIRSLIGKDLPEDMLKRFVSMKGQVKKRKGRGSGQLPEPTNIPLDAPRLQIFTDGACEVKFTGGPRKGAYAFIIQGGEKEVAMTQGFNNTTNNRMEIMAAIAALNQVEKPSHITIYSDSQYFIHSFKLGWVYKWEKKRWYADDKGTKRKNWDLFEMLLRLTKKHQIEFKWVRGHNGHPENERCDKMAEGVLKNGPFVDDIMYERMVREEKFERPVFQGSRI